MKFEHDAPGMAGIGGTLVVGLTLLLVYIALVSFGVVQ